jgi:6-phosphogluconolactonase (cycloisomerase 2 family)
VFTIDNASDANHVLAFERGRDGSLTAAGAFATGGTGTGAGLGTQGALAFALDGRVLIVVNAGSNDISSFTVSGAHLRLRSRVASGGVSPESVAAHDHLVYALNGGAPNGVSGFWLTDDGELFALPGSTQTLSGASVAPAQVGFTPRGRELVVTERGTSDIDVLPLGGDGLPRERLTFASAGTTPYGFAFSRGTLVVSDAFGGAAGAGAVSSYALDEGGSLVDVSQAVPDGQSAPCWVAATGDGRWAVTTNAHSGTISAYGVADDGSLTLGATSSTGEGSTPIDLGFDARSEHLYVLDAGNHAIEGYVLGAGGALTSVAALGGLPASATGIVAR